MIGDLSQALKAFLEASQALPADTEVAFERPSDTYKPDKSTLNLYLYDIHEHTDLRDHVPRVTPQAGGGVRIEPAPVRVTCSYLLTAWVESGVTGEEAVLAEHQMLGAVLATLHANPTLPQAVLTGNLASQLYPVALRTSMGELSRNPAEFWSALGGKLRPSISLSAVITLDPAMAPVYAPRVSSKTVRVHPLGDAAQPEATLFALGGLVRRADNQAPVAGASVTLNETGQTTQTDAQGGYRLAVPRNGPCHIQVRASGYAAQTRAVVVPGNSPTAFDIQLTPVN